MKKMNLLCLLFFIFFLTSCSSNSLKSTNKVEKSKSVQTSSESVEPNSQTKTGTLNNDNSKDKVNSVQNITEKIKNYILNGQEEKTEAQKIKWSKTFLDKVDIESLYKKYIAYGGKAEDLESFALYITKNAPIADDWKDMFNKDLNNSYGEKAVRFEHLNDDLYQVYVNKNGSEVPFVVVSSRTGYFHG